MKTFFKTPEAIGFDKKIDKSPYKEPLLRSMEQGSWAMTCWNKIGTGQRPKQEDLQNAGVAQKQQKR
jgi:hypothetical protein